MQVKDFSEITDPETWELSKSEDIIFTKAGTSGKRVMMTLERYKELKKSLNVLLEQNTFDPE